MFECRLLILNAHSVRCAHVADSLARLRCAPPSADLTPVPFPKGKGSKVKESRSIHSFTVRISPVAQNGKRLRGGCPHPRAPGALALSLDRERDRKRAR